MLRLTYHVWIHTYYDYIRSSGMSVDFNHIHSMSKSFIPQLEVLSGLHNLHVACFLLGSKFVTSNLFREIQVPCINSIVQVVGNDVDMSQHVLRTLTSTGMSDASSESGQNQVRKC
jgi:hypothetical protein